MAFQPISKRWPDDRAILLVHGIGDLGGDYYNDVKEALRQALGDEWDRYAVYPLYYEPLMDWFREKSQLADVIARMRTWLCGQAGGDDFAEAVADSVVDVVWPVLSRAARRAVREAYLLQLMRLVKDGMRAEEGPIRLAKRLKISIVCHSFGCFHTYEALHAAARSTEHGLQPATDYVRFANVIFMASPVQLVRSVAGALGPLVPRPDELATLAGDRLIQPAEVVDGETTPSVTKWISITGELDVVGGHLFREKVDWAYMDVQGQESIVDRQEGLRIGSKGDLAGALRAALREAAAPDVTFEDPHAWTGYVERNAGRIRGWLTV